MTAMDTVEANKSKIVHVMALSITPFITISGKYRPASLISSGFKKSNEPKCRVSANVLTADASGRLSALVERPKPAPF